MRIAAEVKGFDPTVAMDRKMARRMSRFIHFAMAAAVEAVEASGLDFSTATEEQRDRDGRGHQHRRRRARAGHRRRRRVLDEKGPGQVSPFAIPALSGSMAAAQVSMRYGITGPGHDPGRGVREQRDRVPGRAAADPRPASATW